MNTVTSKRHPVNFYCALLFAFIFSNAVGIFLFAGFFKLIGKPAINQKVYLMPIFGLVCVVLAFYTVYQYYKSTPNISISLNSIKIGKRNYNTNDIISISFTGKHRFPYLTGYNMEGVSIEFNNLKHEIFYDSMYSNSSVLKAHLYKLYTGEDGRPPVKAIDSGTLSSDHFYFYKGNLFLNLIGISAIILTSCALLLLFTFKNTASTVFGLIMTAFFYILYGYSLHYFALNEKFFVIKNHLFLWKNKGYNLSDIKEVVFETQGKTPNSLRLILNDYTNKLYPAGSLSESQWNELQEELEKLNITVRNEL